MSRIALTQSKKNRDAIVRVIAKYQDRVTCKELAALIGVGQNTYSTRKRNGGKFTAEELALIQRALHIPVEEMAQAIFCGK